MKIAEFLLIIYEYCLIRYCIFNVFVYTSKILEMKALFYFLCSAQLLIYGNNELMIVCLNIIMTYLLCV